MKLLAVLAGSLAGVLASSYMIQQCRKPTGWLGRFILRTMNRSHSRLISWGLAHANIEPENTLLDIGCGGGLTIRDLAGLAPLGSVYGVDYSTASVASSTALNREAVESGKVVIQNAAVSRLPFSSDFSTWSLLLKPTIIGLTSRVTYKRYGEC